MGQSNIKQIKAGTKEL